MRETRVEFQIGDNQYILFVINRLLRPKMFLLMKKEEHSRFLTPIPVKVSMCPWGDYLSTLYIKLELLKKRGQKAGEKERRTCCR